MISELIQPIDIDRFTNEVWKSWITGGDFEKEFKFQIQIRKVIRILRKRIEKLPSGV